MTKAAKVLITQNDKQVPVEVIAHSIKGIAEGIRNLRRGPLNDKALVLLIQHAAPNVGGKYNSSMISVVQIRAVLEGIENLEKTYLKQNKKSG